MNTGLYFDVSWDDYRAIDLPSPSLLKHGLRSMKRLKRAMDGECKPSSKTVAIGQAVHCMVSGETDRIAVMPRFELDAENVTASGKPSKSKSTSYFKSQSGQWRSENAGKQELTDYEMHCAKRAVAEIESNRKAKDLLNNSSLEVTVIAEIFGLKVKTRMDGLVHKVGQRIIGWDIKTCPDVEPSKFYRHAKNLGYWFQFAFHRACLASLGMPLSEYQVIAAEVDGDFDCGVIDIPFPLLDVWDGKVRRVIEQYKLACQTNQWRGIYESGVGQLEVPNWDMEEDMSINWGGSEVLF